MTTKADNSVTLNLSVDELRAIRQALYVRSQTVIGACVDEQTLYTLEARIAGALLHIADEQMEAQMDCDRGSKPRMTHWTFAK